MIIYGTKAKLLATEPQTEKCNNCGSQNTVNISVFQKYAHIFWLPFFPIGKTGVSQCSQCRQILKLKQFQPSPKLDYENLKGKSKTPIWTFTGLALVVVLVIFAVYEGQQNDKKNAALILAPRQGDIFEIKTKDNQYTLYKVDDVRGDSVLVRINQYETNKESGLSDLKAKGDASYSEETAPFLKSELRQMLENGEITDIDR